MSQNDPKRIWMAGLKRQGCFGAGGVLLDRFAEATVIEKLERGAAVALANKIARMAWALMAKGERYNEPVALGA